MPPHATRHAVSTSPLTCDLHLLSWACTVYEVVQQDDLLVAGQAAGRHGAGGLLQGQLLVVLVDGLAGIHLDSDNGGRCKYGTRHRLLSNIG